MELFFILHFDEWLTAEDIQILPFVSKRLRYGKPPPTNQMEAFEDLLYFC